MMDKDIAMLQYVAAHMAPDQFMIHLLNRFEMLRSWVAGKKLAVS